MKKNVFILFFSILAGLSYGADFNDDFTLEDVSSVCNAVADWQIENPGWHSATNWTKGAEFSGLVEWAELGGDKYYAYLKRRGASVLWYPGRMKYHADDHAVGWYYLEMFRKYNKKYMIKPLQRRFDWILKNQPDVDLEFCSESQKRYSWCDALFMAPPVWINLANLTGESKYLDYANKEWWATTNYLYDTEEHLYFRDSRFFDKREDNGEKVFWGRGNGWVFAGIVRLLKYFPENHPDRKKYETLFKEMAVKLKDLQNSQGFWHASLLDPESYPNPETSSTGFFCYGFAAGINSGLLDEEIYLPVVKKAWKALVSSVHENGMLGWVQAIGEDPRDVKYDDTEVYGIGAFLHAGSQIYRFIERE
jgi:rhamnogalacturonyl hydrolase YesR